MRRRIAILIANVSIFGTMMHGATVPAVKGGGPPTAQGWGQDDNNIVTLTPWDAANLAVYVTSCPWVQPAIDNNATFSNAANWSFRFAQNAGLPNVPAGDFTINLYSAWVVTNDAGGPGGATDLAGNNQARPVNGADGGGANWEVTYTPRPDPANPGMFLDPTGLSFLQVYREILTFNDGTADNPIVRVVTNYFLDGYNDDPAAGAVSPFYEARGVNGNLAGNPNAHWMFDNPYDCENKGTGLRDPNTNEPTCRGGTDGRLLSSDVEFQTFAARNLGAAMINGNPVANNGILYGGEWWGYAYTNADVPEPALSMVAGAALLAMAWIRARRQA